MRFHAYILGEGGNGLSFLSAVADWRSWRFPRLPDLDRGDHALLWGGPCPGSPQLLVTTV